MENHKKIGPQNRGAMDDSFFIIFPSRQKYTEKQSYFFSLKTCSSKVKKFIGKRIWWGSVLVKCFAHRPANLFKLTPSQVIQNISSAELFHTLDQQKRVAEKY